MSTIFCVLVIQANLAGVLILVMFLMNMLSHVQRREHLHAEKAEDENEAKFSVHSIPHSKQTLTRGQSLTGACGRRQMCLKFIAGESPRQQVRNQGLFEEAVWLFYLMRRRRRIGSN